MPFRRHSPPRPASAAGQALRALIRSLVTIVVVGASYFRLPFDRIDDLPAAFLLVGGLISVSAVCTWQVRSVLRSRYPVQQAAEGIVATATVYFAGFSTLYVLLSQADPLGFTEPLSRMGALYFTLTVFATVGFGDIVALTDGTRAVVSVQMIANLILIAVGIRTIVFAARRRRRQVGSSTDDREDVADDEDG
ncbi:potassium channel family protein [Rhodococcus chondri]|uniref:Potassium channel family protein n=1 Tax=Rhodococcus chondri TaxID=3065941 RepID=A0ABU7JVV9_9NOCA|nr:potassium channel family protein [Rhodococcus sp. CC-R104]MEE2034044.1 potassium channel family protein [Rhodococcus sp. CC-R104]